MSAAQIGGWEVQVATVSPGQQTPAVTDTGCGVRPLRGCQIDITNHCRNRCAYCTRFIRHVRQDQAYFMTLPQVEQAVHSLAEMEGLIGLCGGEPTLHPEFAEICRFLQSQGPPERFGLYTAGGPRYEKHLEAIHRTFGFVHLNEHTPEQAKRCRHQPLTLGSQDIVEDPGHLQHLIDDCWLTQLWGGTIGPKGAFACEVAHALDTILDGPGGWPVEPGWWKRDPNEHRAQSQRYCRFCGMAIPLKRETQATKRELFSPGNLALFKEHRLPCLTRRDVRVFDRRFTRREIEETSRTWRPWDFRAELGDDTPALVAEAAEAGRRGQYDRMMGGLLQVLRREGFGVWAHFSWSCALQTPIAAGVRRVMKSAGGPR